ncbi:MAG: hypothetical protein ACOC0A_05445, partial [Planctomycetota bacterium]
PILQSYTGPMKAETESANLDSELHSLLHQDVVVDVTGPFLYIGNLQKIDPVSVTLVDADAHNLRETNTGTERYLIEAKKHGVRINRHRVLVMKRVIMSISPLDAVVSY